jgi:hypothetical protein
MLLHSLATSTVNSGIDSKTPLWITGKPVTTKSMEAAEAEACGVRLRFHLPTIPGTGISHNNEQNGKSNARKR